jgi:hypothetical protein
MTIGYIRSSRRMWIIAEEKHRRAHPLTALNSMSKASPRCAHFASELCLWVRTLRDLVRALLTFNSAEIVDRPHVSRDPHIISLQP